MAKAYFVYIMTNKYNTVLYTGVTGNLPRRIEAHKRKAVRGFSSRYNVNKLVYVERYDDPISAITREKKIKAGSRKKKMELIDKINDEWKDLSKECDFGL